MTKFSNSKRNSTTRLFSPKAQEPKEFWETKTSHIATLEDLTEEAIHKIDELIR